MENHKEDCIIDKKLKCCSILKTMSVSEYLEMVENAYQDRGGIRGQREPLKQKTAITIRKRMINDIIEGTILPPVVIGIIVDEDSYEKAKVCEDVMTFISDLENPKISIIDGMQRTTAILEAKEVNSEVEANRIRVELWISCDVNSMLYRMLVLNTGQVPWNMRRQIELIFDSIISKVQVKLPEIDIYRIDDKQRRSKSGQYSAKDLIEMFLAFGARTWKVDTKEKVADEFTRGDLIQSSEKTDMVEIFCKIVGYMYRLDILLDEKLQGDSESTNKFKRGKDLFASQPAKIGLAAASGEYILGRPGASKTTEQIIERIENVNKIFEELFIRLNSLDDVTDYMDFDTLSEMLNIKSSKVGDAERDKFYSAFKLLFNSWSELDSFTECWRA